jgi:hypothetical protein
MQTIDPKTEDVGNVVLLEHVNVTIPDQSLATLFYIVGLGFTRDPYMNVGLTNMWINLGENQFHLPTRPTAQVIPGVIGLAVPDLDAVAARLEAIGPQLADSLFGWSRRDTYTLDATCPWGNSFRVYGPGAPYVGEMRLGIPYVEFKVGAGAAGAIARFYKQVLGASARVESMHGHPTALVEVGRNQQLLFTETSDPIPPYDGHHIAIYVADFSGPCAFLQEHGLVSEDPAGHQLRFRKLVDPVSGEHVFTLEHEVRSLKHPMFHRPLVNRNPAQTQAGYVRGADALVGY